MDGKPMPIRPSGGKLVFPKPVEYWVAAPSVWDFAYGEMYERFVGKEKKNMATYNHSGNSNVISIFLATEN